MGVCRDRIGRCCVVSFWFCLTYVLQYLLCVSYSKKNERIKEEKKGRMNTPKTIRLSATPYCTRRLPPKLNLNQITNLCRK
jgi:hypothetical protein